MSPSASSASTARRARSSPSASRSCAAPILASKGMSGATRRNLRVSPWELRDCRLTRCEPTHMAIPKTCAASLRCRLIVSARGMPPVMELISSGARMVLPSSEARRSICVRSNSGNAQCAKRMSSQPAATVAGAVRGSSRMSRWSSLRWLRAVSCMLASSVASGDGVASLDRTDGSARTPPPPARSERPMLACVAAVAVSRGLIVLRADSRHGLDQRFPWHG